MPEKSTTLSEDELSLPEGAISCEGCLPAIDYETDAKSFCDTASPEEFIEVFLKHALPNAI